MILDVEFREFLEISPDILTSLPLVCFQKRSRSRTLGYRYYLYLCRYLYLSFADCLCVAEKVQIEDPRLEWRALQEDMLRSYLVTAQVRTYLLSYLQIYLPLSIISTGGPHQQAGAGVDQAGAAEPRPGRVPPPQHDHVRPAVPVHHQL